MEDYAEKDFTEGYVQLNPAKRKSLPLAVNKRVIKWLSSLYKYNVYKY